MVADQRREVDKLQNSKVRWSLLAAVSGGGAFMASLIGPGRTVAGIFTGVALLFLVLRTARSRKHDSERLHLSELEAALAWAERQERKGKGT